MVIPISLPIFIIIVVALYLITMIIRESDHNMIRQNLALQRQDLIAMIEHKSSEVKRVETKLDIFIEGFEDDDEELVTESMLTPIQEELDQRRNNVHHIYESLAKILEREKQSHFKHDALVLRALALGFYADVDLVTETLFIVDKIQSIKLRLITTCPGIIIGRKANRYERFLEICQNQVNSEFQVEVVENNNRQDQEFQAKTPLLTQIRQELDREVAVHESWLDDMINGDLMEDESQIEDPSDTLEMQIDHLQPVQHPVEEASILAFPIPAIPVAYPDPDLEGLFDCEDCDDEGCNLCEEAENYAAYLKADKMDDTGEVILLDENDEPISWAEVDKRKRGLSGFDGGC